MSHLPDAQVDDILERSELKAFTPYTLTDPELIRARVRQARQEGFSLSLQENLIGEIVLAAAVVDHEKRPIAAIHISGLLTEWEPETFTQRFSSLAISAARTLSGKSSSF